MYTVPYYSRKLGLIYKDIIETNCNITSEFLCILLTDMSHAGEAHYHRWCISRTKFDEYMDNVYLFAKKQSPSTWDKITGYHDYGTDEPIDVEISIQRWGDIPRDALTLCDDNLHELHEDAKHKEKTTWCDSWDVVYGVYGE
jgi:hypothetical protein